MKLVSISYNYWVGVWTFRLELLIFTIGKAWSQRDRFYRPKRLSLGYLGRYILCSMDSSLLPPSSLRYVWKVVAAGFSCRLLRTFKMGYM